MFPNERGPHGPSTAVTTPAGNPVVVALLGEIALRKNGELAALPGARARLLLAALAIQPGRSRSAQALIDDVWGEQPPRAPMNALHTQVSRLRSALPDGALEIGPAGYRLALADDQVDLSAARRLEQQARARHEAADQHGSLAAIAAARTLWRGEPGADLPPGLLADELMTIAAARWAALDAIELATRAATGDLAGAITLAQASAQANPLDEAAARTLMRLLAAAGRPNEALEVFAGIRSALIDQLGADPAPALVELNAAILRGDVISISPVPAVKSTVVVADSTPPSIRDPWAKHDDSRGLSTSTLNALAVEADSNDSRATARHLTNSGPVVDSHADTPTAPDPALSAIGVRAAPNALLGRDGDLTDLAALLHESRVVTVLGPGGTGKTRVANELGAQVAHHESVVLVELASVRPDKNPAHDPQADIVTAISATLGLGELTTAGLMRTGHPLDGRQRLREALTARPILLILDNCEHVIDAVAGVVADLVGSCEQLTVLTTSRAPLSITAETVYPLAPLTVDASGSPATDLFMARARAVRPSVRLDPEVVARLCRTLDGLPLAIELAAARVRTMSVEEIDVRLEHRFALLRSGDRTSPERHRTLHAVIAWSWNLLDAGQQVALRRLCRFPAGFTLEAATVVAGGAEVGDVALALEGLVGQSLLTVVEDDAANIRYRMLETVREFGEEQLALTQSGVAAGIPGATDESTLVMYRMPRWARDFTLDMAQRFRTDDQVPLVLSMSAELDNLVAVLRYALERRDARTAYLIYPTVAMIWVIRGAHMDLMGWIQRVIALPPPPDARGLAADMQMLSHIFCALHLAYMGGGMRETATIRARARRLLRPGHDLSEAARFIGQVITVPVDGTGTARMLVNATRSADPETRQVAYIARANARENLGQLHASTRDALQALAILESKDVWGMATVCQHLGGVAGQTARYAESVQYYRRCAELLNRLLAFDESVEIRSYLAASLVGIGELAQARRELELAVGQSEVGSPHRSPIDDPGIRRNHRLATVVASLAEVELAEGDIEAGIGHYLRALELIGWPEHEFTPGPGLMMLASAALGARVLHNRPAGVESMAIGLAGHSARQLGNIWDIPQAGAVACAVGSALLELGREPERGLELLALAPAAVARQDMPSMQLKLHIARHRAAVGEERMDAALRAAARLRRRAAAERIMVLLRELSGVTGEQIMGLRPSAGSYNG